MKIRKKVKITKDMDNFTKADNEAFNFFLDLEKKYSTDIVVEVLESIAKHIMMAQLKSLAQEQTTSFTKRGEA